MWLARLFGRGKDDEPSEFPPHPASNARVPAGVTGPLPAAKPERPHKVVQKGKGFDPYNSGAFRKAAAWDRVIGRD